jgi:hypothetical protein
MSEAWVLSIRDSCAKQHVPFFFKQWGGVRKKLMGRTLGGRLHNGYPTIEATTPPSRDERMMRMLSLSLVRRSSGAHA